MLLPSFSCPIAATAGMHAHAACLCGLQARTHCRVLHDSGCVLVCAGLGCLVVVSGPPRLVRAGEVSGGGVMREERQRLWRGSALDNA